MEVDGTTSMVEPIMTAARNKKQIFFDLLQGGLPIRSPKGSSAGGGGRGEGTEPEITVKSQVELPIESPKGSGAGSSGEGEGAEPEITVHSQVDVARRNIPNKPLKEGGLGRVTKAHFSNGSWVYDVKYMNESSERKVHLLC